MQRNSREVNREGNPWYVSSQFEWADNPSIRPIYEKRLRYIAACIEKAKVRLGPHLRLLDAGCGDGYWLARLSRIEGLTLTGIDYNPLRVERARQVTPNAEIILGDLTNVKIGKPFDAPFDVILLNQVIEHVEDDVGLLQTMRELLGSGGTLILGTPNEGSHLQQWALRRSGGLHRTDHVHFYTEKEIRNKIRDAGFCIESVMREVFYPGSDRLYYWLTRHRCGFRFLEFMTWLWPSECSEFYFECRV